MHVNKKLVVALTAGITVAGIAAFLLGTGRGRKITKEWKMKTVKIADDMEGLLDVAKAKLASIQKQISHGCEKEERHEPAQQEG